MTDSDLEELEDSEEDQFVKRVIDELDAMWEVFAKIEVTAIKADTKASTMAARLRSFEQKMLRFDGESADLRRLLARLQAQLESEEEPK